MMEIVVPSVTPAACYAFRCLLAMPVCAEETPRPTPTAGGGTVSCHLHEHGPQLAGGSVHDLLVARSGE